MIIAFLIATLAGIALFLIAEGVGRWWLRTHSRYAVWPPSMRQEIRLARDVFPELEPRVRFEINTDGERGQEVPRDTSGLFRVLATGGSAVECFALDQPTSWPAGVERLLNSRESLQALDARAVHVGNIAHSGVGAAELDLIFERVLPQYERLDLILIMVGASDVYHWIEEGAPPGRPAAVVPEPLLFAAYPKQTFGWKPGALALAEIARRLRRRWLRPLEVKERKTLLVNNLFLLGRQEAEQIHQSLPLGDVLAESVAQDGRERRRAAGKVEPLLDYVLIPQAFQRPGRPVSTEAGTDPNLRGRVRREKQNGTGEQDLPDEMLARNLSQRAIS